MREKWKIRPSLPQRPRKSARRFRKFGRNPGLNQPSCLARIKAIHKNPRDFCRQSPPNRPSVTISDGAKETAEGYFYRRRSKSHDVEIRADPESRRRYFGGEEGREGGRRIARGRSLQ